MHTYAFPNTRVSDVQMCHIRTVCQDSETSLHRNQRNLRPADGEHTAGPSLSIQSNRPQPRVQSAFPTMGSVLRMLLGSKNADSREDHAAVLSGRPGTK